MATKNPLLFLGIALVSYFFAMAAVADQGFATFYTPPYVRKPLHTNLYTSSVSN